MCLALCLLLACFPVTGFAAEKSGKCGADLTWTLDTSTGELTISGTGDMDRAPFKEISSSIKSVVIEDGVTSIYAKAFMGCYYLTEVTIADSVSRIGEFAFCDCEQLSSVKLPAALEQIGEGVFSFCMKLTGITIPQGVTYIGEEAFTECWKLDNVVIPEGVTKIDEQAFAFCSNLSNVTLPESLINIARHAFYECWNLEDIYYAGIKSMKENIKIGSENQPLNYAAWHYREVQAPVVKISGNTTTGKPKLTWSSVDGADKYRIYRATSKSGTYSLLDTVTGTSFTDSTATAGKNYYYKVKTVEMSDTSKYSNVVNRVCDLPKPDVTLKVDTASGKPKITFEKISGAEKYYIVRSTSKSGTYTKLATITGTTYIDSTAKAGTNYYYKVKALHEKDAADSAYSTVVNRVCDLAKPVVTLKRNSSGNPWLKWSAISGAEKYEVYRATSKTGTYKLVKTTVTATSFEDRDATAGKTYYYNVRAIHANSAANSAYSAIKYITAK